MLLFARRSKVANGFRQYSIPELLELRDRPECRRVPPALQNFPLLAGAVGGDRAWDGRAQSGRGRGPQPREPEKEWPSRRGRGGRGPPGMGGPPRRGEYSSALVDGPLSGEYEPPHGRRGGPGRGRWDQDWGPRESSAWKAPWGGHERGRGHGPHDYMDENPDWLGESARGDGDAVDEETFGDDGDVDAGHGFFSFGNDAAMDQIERERQQHHRVWAGSQGAEVSR